MKLSRNVVFLAAALSLAACSADRGTRALEGGGIGAAAGAVGAAVIGAPVVAGAAVGAVTGAATGAITTQRQIDLDN